MSTTEPNIMEEELAEIKGRCERTTAGPWRFIPESKNHNVGSEFIQTAGEDIYLTGATLADHDFIAHAKQDIPRLLSEVARLRTILQIRK